MRPAVEAWNRFWFAPVSTSTTALFRIAFGMVALLWTLSLLPDALTFFGREGTVPERDLTGNEIGLLNVFTGDWVVVLAMAVLLVASVAIVLGYHARVASVALFIVLLSLRRRNPWVMNSGDSLLRHMSFFLMLAPAGAALSVDRWRRARERFWEFPARAPWAMRLIQIQVSFVYLFTVWAKARSDEWLAGTAIASSMRVGDLTRFDVPLAWSESLVVSNLLAYGTLAVELALAVLIWNRRARPWVIGAGIALHLFIDVVFSLGFFSTVIFVSYVSFVPEETGDRWIGRLRDRMANSDVRVLTRIAEPEPTAHPSSEDGARPSRVAAPTGGGV